MSSKRESSFHAKEKTLPIFPLLSNFSLTLNSEPLTLTVIFMQQKQASSQKIFHFLFICAAHIFDGL